MAQTTATVTMKTLPMKYKAMQYALASFISKQSSFDEDVKTTLYKELMLFAPVAEQVSFFEAEYDLKNIEKNIVKPIIKAQKDAEKKANAPVKEKKPRAPKKESEPKQAKPKKESEPKQAKSNTKSKKAATKEAEPAPASDDAPEVESCCGKECYTSADDDHEILRCQDSGVPKEDCMNHTDTETKSETTEKEGKKEEALTDEMEAEPYVETPVAPAAAANPKKEKKETKVKEDKNEKNEKKKVTKKSKPADDENKTPKMPNARMVIKNPDEKFLLFQNDKRYWCTDAHFKNGTVYEDTADEDGDSAPGREIGTIENGVLMIHHDV